MADGAARPELDLTALAPMLGAVCQEYRDRHRAALAARIRAGESGLSVATLHARIVDGMLSALFCAAEATLRMRDRERGGDKVRLALVAVGGYGRGQLGLCSDLDLIVLAERSDDPRAAQIAEALLYPLWDLGLEIGHAVRGVDATLQLAREDLRTATMLLDVRRVAGDAGLVDDLLRGARRQVFDPGGIDIVQKLIDERMTRHERFGGSRYLLEPDVKHGCGGLRDLDIVLWATQIRKGAKTPEEAVRASLLVSREAEALTAAREAFWTIRQELHLRAGRRQDRLTFEDQEEVAARLGYADAEVGVLGVERFMQSYYRHARAVEHVSERVLEAACEPERRERARSVDNGDGTLVFDNRITLEDSERLAREPALALRLYRQVMRRGLPAYGFAREAVSRATADAAWCASLRESAEAREIFLELLSTSALAPARTGSPQSGSILGELHEVGLLLAMLPEFEPVTGRVQHDVYHVYTVDVHSIAAVDRLRAVLRGDQAEELPLATQLASEAPSRVALFVGVLLHDVGKGRGRDHSVIGAELAKPAALRLGLSEEDAAHVEWLVRDHLRLYHWAMRRDTSDPATLREIVDAIGTLDRLRDLFLLTVVDLGTTSPTALSSWKARMLDDLFLAARDAIEAASAGTTPPSRAAHLRVQAKTAFEGKPAGEATLAFVAEMPDRYLVTHGLALASEHARIANARASLPVHVAATHRAGTAEGESELVVVADDRPGLLADIAAVLAGNRLAIQTAHIYTRHRASGAEAFDVFQVRRHGVTDGAPLDETTLARVGRDLTGLLGGEIPLVDVLARRPSAPAWAERKRPDVRTEILIDNAVSPRFTVVDVFTRDRFGLLHAIARALHEAGLSIALSKVSTEGERVADVFYVSTAGGTKIDPASFDAVRAALVRAIEALAPASPSGVQPGQ
jgi:[protein-PII] uridylyltransferase